jgi:hypothetical protein
VTAPAEGGTGRGRKVLVGFVVLHVLCCGALVLGGAGLLAAAGGLLGQPLLVVAGVLLAIAAVAVGIRRTRRSACTAEQAGTPRAAKRPDRTAV